MAFSPLVEDYLKVRDGLALPPVTPKLPATADSTAGWGAGTSTGSLAGLDPDEAWIIQKESSGRTTAKNPKSSAFGLGQLIKGNREHYGRKLGIDPNSTRYEDQLKLFRAYISQRYGTAAKARQFWMKNRYY